MRGNWQKRVENAQSRRKETKQRKQRKENKSIYKSYVQTQLWPLLDTYEWEDSTQVGQQDRGSSGNEAIVPRKDVLHLWLDTMPESLKVKDTYVELEDDGETNGRRKKKKKKGDIEREEDEVSFQSPKSRKHSKKSGSSSKKPHPRSHAATTVADLETESDKNQYFCREDFFTGACTVKKSPYHRMDVQNGQWTLAAILLNKEAKSDKSAKSKTPITSVDSTVQTVLEKSLEAYVKSFEELEIEGSDQDIEFDTIGPMDPLYYISVDLSSLHSTDDDEELKEGKGVSDLLQTYFVSQKTAIGSIMYAVYDQTLIFDRYQGGLLLNTKVRENFFERDKKNCLINSSSPMKTNEFDAIILEHIVSFLPNEAAGVLPLVSKSWHLEIGVSSPGLWKDLLYRNNWPLMKEEGGSTTHMVSARDHYRNLFLGHYGIIRNIDHMNQGGLFEYMNINDNATTHGAILKFNSSESKRKGAYHLCAWDEKSVIVANRHECTLSLYEAKESENGPKCRKSVEVRVAPFPHSKKTICELNFINLDEGIVSCVFNVNGLANYITAISRDDLLSTSGSPSVQYDGGLETELKMFDMNEKIAEYCESHMDADFLTGDLLLYLQGGGDFKEFGLSINGQCECGKGRFLLKAWICIPGDDDVWIETIRVAILFSVPHSSIMTVEVLAESLGNRQADLVLTSYIPKRRQLPTTIICTSNDSPKVIMFQVDTKTDKVVISTLRDELLISSMFMGDLEPSLSPRLSLVTENEIILVDVISPLDEDGDIEQSKITLSFLSIQDGTHNLNDVTTLDLEGEGEHLKRTAYQSRLRGLRVRSVHGSGDHIILIYTFVSQEPMPKEHSGLIAVHIPSRREAYACLLGDDLESPELLICKPKDETMLSFINDQGIFLTSRSIRVGSSVAEVDEEKEGKATKKPKKKKQRGAAKGRKKDGFARGMSVRG